MQSRNIADRPASVSGRNRRRKFSGPRKEIKDTGMNGTVSQNSDPNRDIWFNWNNLGIETSPQKPAYSGTFFNETLSDGLQAPYVRNITREQKLNIVDHMVRCGVRSADLGFPGSDPAALLECAEIAKCIVASGYPLASFSHSLVQ
jgi:2-isopropylmalate synthase